MKKEIHPTYFRECTVTCACGSVFTVGSTSEEMRIELCSKCHPFYTGKQKFVDTARRVEKFQERFDKVSAAAAVRKGKKVKKAVERTKKEEKAKAAKKDSAK